MMISGVGQSVINVMDTAFLGRVGQVELGASAIAGLYYFTVSMLAMGFGTGIQILIAKYYSKKEYTSAGYILRFGFKFLMSIALFFFLLNRFAGEAILSNFINSPKILEATLQFLHYRDFGYFPLFIIILCRGFFLGIENTKIIAWVTLVMATSNFVLNYALVFGHLGAPAMGIGGSALASSISEGIAAVICVAYCLVNTETKMILFQDIKLKSAFLRKELLVISLPVMLQFFTAMVSWFVFFLIIEQTGERPLAISNLVRNVYMIVMIPLLACTNVTGTVISNLSALNKRSEMAKTLQRIGIMSVGSTAIVLILVIVIDPLISLTIFTDDKQLMLDTVSSLYVICGSCLFFALANVYLSAVNGLEETKASLVIEITTLIFYLGASYTVAIKWLWPIELIWCTEYIYFFFIGILSYLYLKRLKVV